MRLLEQAFHKKARKREREKKEKKIPVSLCKDTGKHDPEVMRMPFR
jgi:hypothetical protein